MTTRASRPRPAPRAIAAALAAAAALLSTGAGPSSAAGMGRTPCPSGISDVRAATLLSSRGGWPVRGVRVLARSVETGAVAGVTSTDTSGRFSFTGLCEDEYTIYVAGNWLVESGWVNYAWDTVEPTQGQATSAPAGDYPNPIRVDLR